MYLPNYKNGSVVNLMSSIEKSFGCFPQYQGLDILNSYKLEKSKNVVLIVIDGLGYEYLIKNGKSSILYKHLKKKITSVFPSTTASCIPTFATGVAPSQHALTGWFMYLKETGMAATIINFTSRSGEMPLYKHGIRIKNIFNQKTIFEKIKANSYAIQHQNYIDSEFNNAIIKAEHKLPYSDLSGFFRQIKKAITCNQNRKYIYAYWHYFDSVCHKYGVASKQALKHFKQIDKEFSNFLNIINGTGATVIVTADHGLIDYGKAEMIELDKHPELADTLIIPLCGEPRVAYCYVNPFKIKQFENYVKNNLSKYCKAHKSEDLVKKGYFGLFATNEKLFDRIGNYALIMKENYVIIDFVLGEEERRNKKKIVEGSYRGAHGGTSKEEMFVPLIVVNK
ncbi:MAG: alkaline phosphatase family protein [Candidatus Falkowbacteria bacterium]